MKLTTRVRIAAAVLLLWTSLAVAQEAPLRFAPEPGKKWDEKLTGQLLDASMQGQSLGIDGSASADVAAEIVGPGAAANTVNLKFVLSNVKSQLNGQASTPAAPQPLALQVDALGKMSMAVPDGQEGGVNFMDTGGIPLQMVSLLAHIIRFQEAAVGKDSEWTIEDHYNFPGMGDVPINTRWKLCGQDGTVAHISSTAVAALPDFKAPNPMVPGTEMDVRAGRVTITESMQDYDTALSRVVKTEAKLRIDAKIDMQGMQMPLALTIKYTLTAAEPPKEPAR